MKPATEILLSAAFALTPEENWTQHYLGRNADGCFVEPNATGAVSWCVLGALDAAGGRSEAIKPLHEAIGAPRHEFGVMAAIAGFNNTHTHAEVLAALYKAAEIAEGQ